MSSLGNPSESGAAGPGADLLTRLPEDLRGRLRAAPSGVELAAQPMLATLSQRRELSADWLLERKLDGERVLAVREGGRVRLFSRTGRRLNATYPELVEALEAQECEDFTADGEVVAFSHGRTDFSRLQQRMGLTRPAEVRASPVSVYYYLFDLLRLEGVETTQLPLRARKGLLRDALAFGRPLRWTAHRNADPEHGATADRLLEEACARDWEGLIAKRAAGRYQRRRSTDWLKLKCSRGQEFVIGGFTEPSGSRVGFGALLLGYYDHGRLRYAGKVGTGFDQRTLLRLSRTFGELRRTGSPFADPVRERGAHWVEPRLVAQIAFTEWTRDGMLRHPRYLGLRDDKAAADVVRERPAG
ncbi:non-homologous end-joining DNA ligase [Streptomyces sp. TS71-3]|uniref:non-homologous end-joining DNA ligase n=1 Tax=Streptomyces sp. TS71-3 TaxID=2733862 RepID=UPI001B18E01A|nr:non-homologous end-joining DNA ligase [Streptomyces sp. TS71-3]GHJ42513.1 ATP-dependent DNA ligase [Streptomyces sp. TS71-3]